MNRRPPSLAEMLTAGPTPRRDRPSWPANPFPPGIRPGSTTDKVLAELRRAAPLALDHSQLRQRCMAGRGAVSWAVLFLAHLGKIERLPDPRSPLYLRYRAKEGRP